MKVDRTMMRIMRFDEIIRRNYGNNPDKVREIFETARHTDMDEAELAEHLRYLGNDDLRIRTNAENEAGKILYPCLIGGLGNMIFGNIIGSMSLSIVGFAMMVGSSLYLSLMQVYSRNNDLPCFPEMGRKYEDARQDAARNLETRTQTVR